ncbi:hypothetical protein [Nonomuraea sp. 10N515B]|uniref:hypothetical protein n=1 Tax=Nonomuraea sp. 10N515B TaxID=3457422 RepID=UPI003FCE1AE0
MLPAFGLILAAGFCGKYFGCALSMQELGFSRRESFVAVLTTAAALPLYKLALPDRLERTLEPFAENAVRPVQSRMASQVSPPVPVSGQSGPGNSTTMV